MNCIPLLTVVLVGLSLVACERKPSGAGAKPPPAHQSQPGEPGKPAAPATSTMETRGGEQAPQLFWPCQQFAIHSSELRLLGGSIGGTSPNSLVQYNSSPAGLMSVGRGGRVTRYRTWGDALWSRTIPELEPSTHRLLAAGRDGILATAADENGTEVLWIGADKVAGPWQLDDTYAEVFVGPSGAAMVVDDGESVITTDGNSLERSSVKNVRLLAGIETGWWGLVEHDGEHRLQRYSSAWTVIERRELRREWPLASAFQLAVADSGTVLLAALDHEGVWGLWAFDARSGQRRLLVGPTGMVPDAETPVLGISESQVVSAFPVKGSPFICAHHFVDLASSE